MSALHTATGNDNYHTAHASAPVVKNTRIIRGFTVNAIGQINEADFTLEYLDSGTRISCDDRSCVVGFAYSNHNATLVHVRLRSDKIKPLHPLWSGVRGGKLVGRVGDDDCFVKVTSGEHLSVFYNDGTVAIFRSFEPSATAFKFNLSAEHAFDARFGYVSKMLAEAEQMHGDDKIIKQDRNLHELAAIVGMSTRYPELRKQVIDYVVEMGIPLRMRVFEHFRQACSSISDIDAWMQIRAFNDPLTAPAAKTGNVKGKPADVKARKAERANRDRAERATMKGIARSDDSKSHKSKK